MIPSLKIHPCKEFLPFRDDSSTEKFIPAKNFFRSGMILPPENNPCKQFLPFRDDSFAENSSLQKISSVQG